jgi:peroxiredoxin
VRDARSSGFWGAGRVARYLGCWGLLVAVLAGCSTAKVAADTGSRPANTNSVVGLTTWKVGSRPELHELSGTTLSGARLSLSALRGKVIVLNAWASWCFPCRSEVPALVAASRSSAARGVTFLGIDEQDSADAARAFVAAEHMPYPSLFDDDGTVLGSLGLVPANAIPSTLVLDRTGRVAARVIGATTAAELSMLLDQLAPKS